MVEPALPDDVSPADLERSVRAELRSLSKSNADAVAGHLVMVGRLLPDDPENAYAHAMAAQRRAGRIAVVREIVGVAAYHCGLWAQALSELRAARRMSGSSLMLPMMADCERGLGRPERALELAGTAEARALPVTEQIEMAIVVSGARRDLGQLDAAVLAVQLPALETRPVQPHTARLRYAYADALLAVGRQAEAEVWFARAADADPEGLTDADERLTDLQGLEIVDLADGLERDVEVGDGSNGAAGEGGDLGADSVVGELDGSGPDAVGATGGRSTDAVTGEGAPGVGDEPGEPGADNVAGDARLG